MAQPVIVFDFETTGLSPQHGDRPIEVGAVVVENQEIIDRFQSLMNPGFTISPFIESYTGISNELVAAAPEVEEVMVKFADFIGNSPLVAHNASFDRKFLDTELAVIGTERYNPITCSMLTARRVFPEAPDHKLSTLVNFCNITNHATFHRALADAEMTGKLWIIMLEYIQFTYGIHNLPFDVMQRLTKISKAKAPGFLQGLAEHKSQ